MQAQAHQKQLKLKDPNPVWFMHIMSMQVLNADSLSSEKQTIKKDHAAVCSLLSTRRSPRGLLGGSVWPYDFAGVAWKAVL